MRGNSTANGSNGTHDVDIEQMESFEGLISGDWLSSLVNWLNGMLPDLRLPLDATEEELRQYLIDGTIFCTILNKLRPSSAEMDGGSKCGSVNVKRFLMAMDEMGLPSFELSDIEQGHMMPVLQCLKTLRVCVNSNGEANNIQNPSRKTWNLSGEFESIQLKQGYNADLSDATILELMKPSSLENASTQSLFSMLYQIMDGSIERNKRDLPHYVACLLRKIVEEIEWRVSTRAENLKNQNNLYRAREEKYQSRIRAFETLVKGTLEENKVALNKLQHIKIEKSKVEEMGNVEKQNLLQLKKNNIQNDLEISRLRKELESSKEMHERHCLQLEAQAEGTKAVLEVKLKELESLLTDSKKKADDLQSFSESTQKRWKSRECSYQSFIDQQFGALKGLREISKFIKREALKTKKSHSEELNHLGKKLKGLVDAARNYHLTLAENRILYNEIQDLKGNIRVYCRIRPFLPGKSKKQTTIEYIGENGELVVSNPLKQRKDAHRLFRFNKVFSPATNQEEVYLDTQPLIRSVLDGYNVCIFAYGQTGSGKTYTMSGPNVSSKEDWGVNYRALNDLFQTSQSRKSSIIYEVGVQMIEIYNEQFCQPNGLAVPEASMHSVKSTTEVLELMNIGLRNRAVGSTALNERSSRSHSVLTVHVCGTEIKTNAVLHGSLHLVDLAGSERVDRSEATGDRLREAQHINKSLSALGDVIFALAQKNAHVPYRNSKLTQVLQSSLGGKAKTLTFVHLNPDVDSYSETISTLKFAQRVSGVELGTPQTHREGRDIKELMEQVAFLKETITKKDQEIERLQLLKGNGNGIKHGMSSLRGHSRGNPQQSQSLSRQQSLENYEKTASDVDKCSVNGDKHSEAGSHWSVDDSKLNNESSAQTNLAGTDLGQNTNDDIELLAFRDGNSEERLCDTSDGDLPMGGNQTDGSICSAVQLTLFPEPSKSSDKQEKVHHPTKASTAVPEGGANTRHLIVDVNKLLKAPSAPASLGPLLFMFLLFGFLAMPIRKRRRGGERVFKFKTFGENGCPVEFDGSFRDNVKAIVEYGHLEINLCDNGVFSWSFQLEVHRHPPLHVVLFIVEEQIQASSSSSINLHCKHCQYVGWGHHMMCNKKYHFLLPSKDTVAACFNCDETSFDDPNPEKGKFNLVELKGHIMHGVFHSNGFGHLLCVNGMEMGSDQLAGYQIMEFWDRLCTGLQAVFSAIPMATRIILDTKFLVKEYTEELSMKGNSNCSNERTFKLLCTVISRSDEIDEALKKPLPPYECVCLKENATFDELKQEVEKNFREVYWRLRNFVVETIVNLSVKGSDLVMGSVEMGQKLVFIGSNEDQIGMDDGGGSGIVDCLCGAKEDDGERLISCDICEVWQHTRCVRIPNNEIPQVFLCKQCEEKIVFLSSLP
ncbi:hypothetical protein GOBAR_AA39823 [Gossypium barbadense]|uniref:Kinesin motor domain-containing protein n=1 Tax=Gossypium barbadense TaxID=3634 RepID=A0A2P5VQ39_GOSBA|nr:hypothetical protein GOBAR_AA39823 [Gossypium barbadense]